MGVLEVIEGNGIYIGAGAGVGGVSLVFNAIIVQPRRQLFERIFPRAIDFGEMEDVCYPNWPGNDPRLGNFLAAAQQTLATLDQRNGSVTLGINPFVSAHPLGGAVLGRACELDGQVKRHLRPYVVDGALIEGSTGLANLSFTIAALAERCLDRILT